VILDIIRLAFVSQAGNSHASDVVVVGGVHLFEEVFVRETEVCQYAGPLLAGVKSPAVKVFKLRLGAADQFTPRNSGSARRPIDDVGVVFLLNHPRPDADLDSTKLIVSESTQVTANSIGDLTAGVVLPGADGVESLRVQPSRVTGKVVILVPTFGDGIIRLDVRPLGRQKKHVFLDAERVDNVLDRCRSCVPGAGDLMRNRASGGKQGLAVAYREVVGWPRGHRRQGLVGGKQCRGDRKDRKKRESASHSLLLERDVGPV
jgi:hypothetical protein